VGMSQSPFTGSQQVYEWPGEWWEAEFTLPPMSRTQAEQWIAFLTALRGSYGTFIIGDPAGKTPMGSVATQPGEQPQTWANSSGSLTLSTLRWASLSSGLLLPGDYLQIAPNLLGTAVSLADPAWSHNQLTGTSGQSDPFGATGAVQFTPNSGATDCYISANATPNGYATLGGFNFTGRLFLKAAASVTLPLQLLQPNPLNVFVNQQVNIGTAWSSFAVTGTAPAGITQLVIQLGGGGTWTASSPAVTAFWASVISPQVGARLHKVLTTFTSDSGGNATIDIFPRTRESVGNASGVITSSPVGQFRLAPDNRTEWSVDAARLYGLAFKAIEAI